MLKYALKRGTAGAHFSGYPNNQKIYMQCMRNPSARGQGHDLEDEGQGH